MLQLYEAVAFELLIGQAVVDELDEVLDDRFPRRRAGCMSYRFRFGIEVMHSLLFQPWCAKMGSTESYGSGDTVIQPTSAGTR